MSATTPPPPPPAVAAATTTFHSHAAGRALVLVKLLLALRVTDLAIGLAVDSLMMEFPVSPVELVTYSDIAGACAFVGGSNSSLPVCTEWFALRWCRPAADREQRCTVFLD